MSLPERALGDVLRLDSADVTVQPDDDYPIAGVYGFGADSSSADRSEAMKRATRSCHRLTAGRLMMSRLKAFEGAITVTRRNSRVGTCRPSSRSLR